MSYARSCPGSDVYIFLSTGGYLECCGCGLVEDPFGSTTVETTAEMLAHLDAHITVGHDVPDYCIDELKADSAENDAWISGSVPSGQHRGGDSAL